MAKKTRDELKAEGAELTEMLTIARKGSVNFAAQIGDGALVVVSDRRRNPDVLVKEAKKKGGGAIGVSGRMQASGKDVTLVLDEAPPGNMMKLVKKHFSERGLPIKLSMQLPDGSVMGDEEEGEEEVQAAVQPDPLDDLLAETAPEDDPLADLEEAAPAAADPAPAEDTAPDADTAAPEPQADPEAELQRMLTEAKETLDFMLGTANAKQAEAMTKLHDQLRAGLPKAPPELRPLALANYNDELNRISWGETEQGDLKALRDAGVEEASDREAAPEDTARAPEPEPEEDLLPEVQEARGLHKSLSARLPAEAMGELTSALRALEDEIEYASVAARAALMDSFRAKANDLGSQLGELAEEEPIQMRPGSQLGELAEEEPIQMRPAEMAQQQQMPAPEEDEEDLEPEIRECRGLAREFAGRLPPAAQSELDAALKTLEEELEYLSPAARGAMVDEFKEKLRELSAQAAPAGPVADPVAEPATDDPRAARWTAAAEKIEAALAAAQGPATAEIAKIWEGAKADAGRGEYDAAMAALRDVAKQIQDAKTADRQDTDRAAWEVQARQLEDRVREALINGMGNVQRIEAIWTSIQKRVSASPPDHATALKGAEMLEPLLAEAESLAEPQAGPNPERMKALGSMEAELDDLLAELA